MATRMDRVAPQRGVGREIVVPVVEEGRALEIVAAAPGGDVDDSRGRQAGGGIGGEARDLELLDRLLGEVLGDPAVDAVVDGRAIDGHVRLEVGGAADGDPMVVVPECPGVAHRLDAHAGLEPRQLQEAPPVEGQALDLLAADDAVDAEARRVQGGGVRLDLDLRVEPPHGQLEIDGDVVTDPEGEPPSLARETRRGHGDLVITWRQAGDLEPAIPPRGRRAPGTGADLPRRHRGQHDDRGGWGPSPYP
jgi:hypothetical protein